MARVGGPHPSSKGVSAPPYGNRGGPPPCGRREDPPLRGKGGRGTMWQGGGRRGTWWREGWGPPFCDSGGGGRPPPCSTGGIGARREIPLVMARWGASPCGEGVEAPPPCGEGGHPSSCGKALVALVNLTKKKKAYLLNYSIIILVVYLECFGVRITREKAMHSFTTFQWKKQGVFSSVGGVHGGNRGTAGIPPNPFLELC